jgi:hypothetical protein
MSSPQERLPETERRLARVEALRQILDDMHRELTAYRELLTRKLAVLQHQKEPAAPAVVVPKRDSSQGVTAQGVSGPVGEERRAAPRRKGNPVPIHLTDAMASTEPFQGWVLDRSQGGLRLLVDQQVAPGTVLNVRPAKAHASFPWIQVRVRSCQPERNSWSLGVQFVAKPAWGELQAFG